MDLGIFTIGENEINAEALSIPLIKGDKGDRGQKGDTGATGYSPVRGVDYWTSEDQEAIISEVESDLEDELDAKVDKVEGKGLSTNDYTDLEKNKLSAIEAEAEVNIIETVKVNGIALTPSSKEVDVPVPTKTSDLSNDSGFGTYSKPSGGIPSTDMTEAVQTSLGKADTAIQAHQDITGKEDKTNKVTSISSSSTDTQYPSAKCVYDLVGNIESILTELDIGGGV